MVLSKLPASQRIRSWLGNEETCADRGKTTPLFSPIPKLTKEAELIPAMVKDLCQFLDGWKS